MAYAAITCLMRTINQSMELTGCDLQPFYAKLESLRAILEKSCNIMGDLEALTSLEAEIAEVAYSAEDMVDSVSRYVLLAQNVEERSKAVGELIFLLEQEIECIDSTMKQWMASCNSMKDLKAQSYSLASKHEHAVERPENIMVGHENEFRMMQKQLAGGERELEVVSIVGMGGIGKTTLATKLYGDPCIMSRFDIRAKVVVSQEYCARNILLGLLSSTSDEPCDELADRLQKRLKGRRYLVVIDDIWTTEAWDDIKQCFPDCNNGSRILLTTRNVEVAGYTSSGKPPYHMRLMNFDESWNLIQRKVFEKEHCSPDFEKVGKQITLKCGGLPLAITVIAGLLSKIGKALDEWQSVAENVGSVISTNLEAQCMRVLASSYDHLPSHLKPCFLYFAIFPEDKVIFLDRLVELWAVEGFLKVEEMRSLEEVAETCLNELIDRNLISIHHLSFDGKIKSCVMHDLTRELCMREARNMNFVNILSGKSRGQISIHNKEETVRCRNSEAHSIIVLFSKPECFVLELTFKVVRVLDLSLIICPTFPRGILHLIHLRYLALRLRSLSEPYLDIPPWISIIDVPPLISSLCYLQTFILHPPYLLGNYKYPLILPSEILTMPQMRHLRLRWNYLGNKLTAKSFALKNLQSLSGWNPRYCTGSFFRLFPNLKKMQILGIQDDFGSCKESGFHYLDQLEELEFHLVSPYVHFLLQNVGPLGSTSQKYLRFDHADVPLLLLLPPDAFPQNLKSLTFHGHFGFPWKDLSIFGKLPKLESLKLSHLACRGKEWEVAHEEGFPHLKFLLLDHVKIRYWRASSDHFPCLERLFLDHCWYLYSIPQEFADITTLALIDINSCRESVVNSAMQIQQDIQDNYGGSIEVHVSRTMGPMNYDDDDDDDNDEV